MRPMVRCACAMAAFTSGSDAHVAFHERCADLARGGLAGLLLYVEDHGTSAARDDALGHGPSQSGGAAGDDGRVSSILTSG